MDKYTFSLKDGKVKVEKDQTETIYLNLDNEDVEDQESIFDSKTKDSVDNIDWAKFTQDFNYFKIKDIVDKVGRSNREKKIIIKAIYDAMLTIGDWEKIPVVVETLLNRLYKMYDENHIGLLDTDYNENTETLNLDIYMKHEIEDYMEKNTTIYKDLDEILNSIDKSTLPEELKTPEAEQLMQKLVNAGLLDNNWKPVNLSIAERGYLADEISSRLKIKYKWKVMGALWNENPGTLRQGMNTAIQQKKTLAYIEKLKKILN